VGTATAPDFALITNFLGSVDVEPACCTGYAAPFLYLDNNSIEMFVGTESGRLFHYTNISGNLSGTFTLSDSLFWQPAEVWEGQRLAPSCTDLDNDGYLDMVVGNYRGGAAFYRGTFPSGAPSTYPREADVRVYPNPAQENLYVSLTGVFGRTRLGLCNVLGEELLTWNMEGAGPLSLDVKGVAPGTYYLRINAVNCTAVKKVIITR
jgi:hypothetical protein